MSHRITTKTEIKNPDIAGKALKSAGWTYSEKSTSTWAITSGPMKGASINFQTGEISGDSDYLNRGDDSMGALKRHYAEALFRAEAQKRGIDIISRTVEKTGEIELLCRANFA